MNSLRSSMVINWINGGVNFGTQNIEIRTVSVEELHSICPDKGLACYTNVDGLKIISMLSREDYAQIHSWLGEKGYYEILCHEFIHCFCGEGHRTLTPINKDSGGTVVSTPKVSSYYDRDMVDAGKIIHELYKKE